MPMPPSPPELYWIHRLARLLLRRLVGLCGVGALALGLLALTPLPWKAYAWLGRGGDELKGGPAFIVLMGGGGIPSESGLMRCYETALQAQRFPKARVLVAMPYEEGESDASNRVADELVLRGVRRDRILRERRGHHTREQAVESFRLLDAGRRQPAMLVVSSPEHVRRSVLAFRKAGFEQVAGAASYGQNLKADLTLTPASRLPVPNPVHSTWLRYRVWDTLAIELRVLRELTALAYYRARGWA